MNTFNHTLNLTTKHRLDSMGETVWLDGNPFTAVYDPAEVSATRVPGGKDIDSGVTVFITRNDILSRGIKKGTILTFRLLEDIQLRVDSITDDGTDLLPVLMASKLKQAVVKL